MRKIFLKCSLLIFPLFVLVTGVGAEEKKVDSMTVEDIKKALGLSIYLQGGYAYNFENPDSQENDLTEAYIDYLAPLGRGLKFRFGKFATYHGAEVIEAKDNPNYSRSFLFNYAIPFTHTGLMISYPVSDALTGNVHIVNGWDNTDDNKKGKTFGLSLGYIPMEQFSMNFNLMYGPEKDDNNSDNRFLFVWVGTIKR